MKTAEPNQTSADQTDASRAKNEDRPEGKSVDDFTPKVERDGKTDSGPEPDVHGREIPPQD